MVRAQEINERTEKCIVKVQSLVLVTEILPLQHLRTCEEQPVRHSEGHTALKGIA